MSTPSAGDDTGDCAFIDRSFPKGARCREPFSDNSANLRLTFSRHATARGRVRSARSSRTMCSAQRADHSRSSVGVSGVGVFETS